MCLLSNFKTSDGHCSISICRSFPLYFGWEDAEVLHEEAWRQRVHRDKILMLCITTPVWYTASCIWGLPRWALNPCFSLHKLSIWSLSGVTALTSGMNDDLSLNPTCWWVASFVCSWCLSSSVNVHGYWFECFVQNPAAFHSATVC